MDSKEKYKTLKLVLEQGQCKSFKGICKIVPASTLSKDLGMNYQTFSRKKKSPVKFTIEEIKNTSMLIKVDPRLLIELILKEKVPK